MMVSLQDYFDPVSLEKPEYEHMEAKDCLLSQLTINTANNPIKSTKDFSLALIGVPEDRNSPNIGTATGPDEIRKQLYRLSRIPTKLAICDLGNLKTGSSYSDTYFGLRDVLFYLLKENTLPLIIGGSNDLLTGAFKALTDARIQFNFTAVDARLDYLPGKEKFDSHSYLNSLFSAKKYSLGHFASVGHQAYLTSGRLLEELEKEMYTFHRLGEIREQLKLAEPVFRDSQLIAFDMHAVKQTDSPGHFNASPNGFYSEEICLLARYAGLSDALKIFGLFEVNPPADPLGISSKLAAQVIWFFTEGWSRRQTENPEKDPNQNGRFTRYLVHIRKANEEITFIKSNETSRWWMEVPLMAEKGMKKYFACTYEDYLLATHQEIPDRWLKAFKRINDLA